MKPGWPSSRCLRHRCRLRGRGRRADPVDDLPVVWVLSTGGTISGRGASPTALAEYKSGSMLGGELVAGVPEITQYANVKVEQIVNVGSPDITLDNWLTIARRINRIFAEDPNAAGIVITHGTSTLEETAYFLNLTVKDDRPVVLVGAQRPATAISADGPLNLLNAIRTAAAPEARGKGVMIVMNDEINAAREVTKTNTYRRRDVPRAGARLSGLRRCGSRQLLPQLDQAPHLAVGVRRLVDHGAAEGGHRLFVRRVEPGDDSGPGRQRRPRHRVRRHRRRHALELRKARAAAGARAATGDPPGARAIEPHRQWPRHRPRGLRRHGPHPRGYAQSPEGAHPAHARAHQDHETRTRSSASSRST